MGFGITRLTRIGDALRHDGLAERHAIEEPQRADDLVQCRPRDPRCNQMNLEGVHIFQAETIRRAAKIPTELRYRVEVRLLRRRRQITDRHVLDHAAAKRVDLSHWKTSCLKGWASKNPRSSQTGGDYGDRSLTAALAARSIKIACLPLLLNQCCSEAPLKILIQQHLPTKDLAPAERLQNARRKKLIVGYKSWIL